MVNCAYGAAADIAFLQFPEAIAVCVSLVHFAQGDVHEVVAVDQVSVERLAVLELDELVGALERTTQQKKRYSPWVCFGQH
jgi:hypothetical protein